MDNREVDRRASSGLRPYAAILALCSIAVVAVVCYGTLRCSSPKFWDPLTKALLPPPWDQFTDGWALTHFVLFAVIGYLFPRLQYLAFAWGLGVLWELVESSLRDRPFYLSKCHYKVDSKAKAGWWYGRWQDIVTNTAGLATGYFIGGIR